MRPAVFLDRDGTLIEDVGYLDRLDRMRVYPYSVDAVRLLNRAGYQVIVLTNQAGVARGFFGEDFVREAHDHLDRCLQAGGARIERYYYCPHHPDAPIEAYRQRCTCRKPQPGMIRQAEQDFDLDLSRSYVVGDRWLDIELAQAVGADGILVRTGFGDTEVAHPREGVAAAAVVANLMEAVSWILRQRTPQV